MPVIFFLPYFVTRNFLVRSFLFLLNGEVKAAKSDLLTEEQLSQENNLSKSEKMEQLLSRFLAQKCFRTLS